LESKYAQSRPIVAVSVNKIKVDEFDIYFMMCVRIILLIIIVS